MQISKLAIHPTIAKPMLCAVILKNMKYVVYKMCFYLDGEFPKFIGIYDEPQELGSGYYQEAVAYYGI